MVVKPPTGTVTFLFTDIEGSTRRWQDEPEAMRALLVEHDAILRDVIDKHRGHLFKHTGDGVAAAFASASDAVVAALEAQARLRGVLAVRMGLHTGEAEMRDGDYFGSTLNRCARLMGVAHGGQVVCSAATIELVRDRDDLRDLGEHRLRDLSRAEHVWQIGGGEFPPLRSLDSARTNLPLQLTSFVGREQEMADLVAALKEQRLVTVTGVGGVGKTRLALQVGASLLPSFVDGVWLVELAPIADSDASLHALANVFLIARRQGMSILESVVDFFKLREVLLVLDNCEHVLSASAELVSSILRGCPGVRFLVTSREALGVAGEQIWSLRSLSLPGSRGPVGDTESVRLFVDRARVARSGFTLSPETEPAIAEICRRLDGIPLAIELAAARVSSLGPADIAQRLTERFRLLTGGRRSALERHQTLRGTVDWSYELLDERARAVFARLSVFAGSFTPDAAEAVASGDDIDEFGVLDVVNDLVNKSMVVADERYGSVRYRMLETLRQYAQERLDTSDEADRYRLRHAEWCVSFAEVAEEARRTADTSFVLLEEIDNLRAGYRWAFDAQRFDLAIGIVAPLEMPFFAMLLPDIARWAQELTAVDAIADHPLIPALHGIMASAAAFGGAFSTAEDYGQRAIEGQKLSPRVGITGYLALGVNRVYEGRYDDAIELMSAAAEPLAERWPSSHLINDCVLLNLGYQAGQISAEDAAADVDPLVAKARQSASLWPLSMALMTQGRVLEDIDLKRSIHVYEECTRCAARSLARNAEGTAWGALTRMYAMEGRRAESLRALRKTIDLWVDVGARSNVVYSLGHAAHGMWLLGENEFAATLAGVVQSGRIARRIVAGPDGRRHDEAIAGLKAVLGHDAFEAAIRHGAAMSYEDVIRFVRDETERRLREESDR